MKRIYLSHFKYDYQYIRIKRFYKQTKDFKVNMMRLKNYINHGIDKWFQKISYLEKVNCFKGELNHGN